jgi:hypothetical protein
MTLSSHTIAACPYRPRTGIVFGTDYGNTVRLRQHSAELLAVQVRTGGVWGDFWTTNPRANDFAYLEAGQVEASLRFRLTPVPRAPYPSPLSPRYFR